MREGLYGSVWLNRVGRFFFERKLEPRRVRDSALVVEENRKRKLGCGQIPSDKQASKR